MCAGPVVKVTDRSLDASHVTVACVFQPVRPSLGRYFAGGGAEGPERVRRAKRRKKEGRAEGGLFCRSPQM